MNSIFENDEIVFHMLLNLDYFDFYNARLVNKRVNDMCNNKLLWIEKGKYDYDTEINGSTLDEIKKEYFKLYDRLDWDYDRKNVVNAIISRCRIIERRSTNKPHIYFNRSYPRLEEFELLSSKLKIGVIAKDEGVGNVLLCLLKVCIIKDVTCIIDWAFDELRFNRWNTTTTNIISVLKNSGDKLVFELHDVFEYKGWGTDKITASNTIENVDIWNIDRIEQTILRMLEN